MFFEATINSFILESLLKVPVKSFSGTAVINCLCFACTSGTDDIMEESAVESKVTATEKIEAAGKDAGVEDEDMEVIDDLEEGSEGSNASMEEEFSDGDELTGSATPSSMSSKSESGLCSE